MEVHDAYVPQQIQTEMHKQDAAGAWHKVPIGCSQSIMSVNFLFSSWAKKVTLASQSRYGINFYKKRNQL